MKKKAMIFAAGLGTRLYPITADKPKALALANGITLLEHAIRFVSKYGFNDIIINTHHFPHLIEDFLKNNDFTDLRIQISYEPVLLDTAGGLAFASSFFSEDDLILLYNVDIITNFNLNSLIDFHFANELDVSLVVQNRNTSRYFLFDQHLHLKGWINKSTNDSVLSPNVQGDSLIELAFNGIHLLNYNVLRLLPSNKKQSLTPFYLDNMNKIKIGGFSMLDSFYWFDCGKIDTLKLASTVLSTSNI